MLHFHFDRNLSGAKQSSRQAMRKCRGLIDSLVGYVKDCVDEEKPDDEVRKEEKNTVLVFVFLNCSFQFLVKCNLLGKTYKPENLNCDIKPP